MLLTILAIFALQDGEAIRRTKVCADGSVLLESQPCPGEDVVELTCALRAYAAQKPSHVTIRLDPAAGLALVRYQTMPWPEQKAELTVLADAFVVATPSRPNGTRALQSRSEPLDGYRGSALRDAGHQFEPRWKLHGLGPALRLRLILTGD